MNATSIEGAASIIEHCWYCLEGVKLHEHNACKYKGAQRISLNIVGTALKVFESMKPNAWLLDKDFTGLTVDGAA